MTKSYHSGLKPRLTRAELERRIEARYDRYPMTAEQFEELRSLGYTGSGYLNRWEAEEEIAARRRSMRGAYKRSEYDY